LVDPPRARRALRLREVEYILTVRVLQVVGKGELGLVIDAVIVASTRYPAASGGAAAIAQMQALLEHAPIGLAARRETQASAARTKGGVADGARHGALRLSILPSFCLLSVPGTYRMSADTLAESH
jgi:hypothetical protein